MWTDPEVRAISSSLHLKLLHGIWKRKDYCGCCVCPEPYDFIHLWFKKNFEVFPFDFWFLWKINFTKHIKKKDFKHLKKIGEVLRAFFSYPASLKEIWQCVATSE